MKRVLLGAIALAGVATSAVAADLPAKVYTKAPPPLVYNWTSCYIGGEGGGLWDRAESISNGTINGVPNGTLGALKTSTKISGGIAGVTAGCNYQVSNFVFGVEGDGSWSGQTGNSTLLVPFNTALSESVSQNYVATIRGRVGYVVYNNVLLYGTGGGAFADLRIREYNPAAAAPLVNSATETRQFSGWTAGGGVEWALANNWSVKAEYLYMDLGRKNFFANTITGCCTSQSTRLTDNLVRFGVNYHFNWFTPVVAKY